MTRRAHRAPRRALSRPTSLVAFGALAALGTAVATGALAAPPPTDDSVRGASDGAARGQQRTASVAPLLARSPAERVLAGMSLEQRVGQLLMVGTPASAPDARTASAIGRYHVGNVMLTGRSSAGVTATRRVVDGLQRRATTSATDGVRLFVATDQEGGRVQVLKGTGFSRIPSGRTQGSWTAATLRSRAAGWGAQLRRAGVNMNLAPVADTVPSAAFAPKNPPVGALDRQYGYTPAQVASRAGAFAAGMGDSGVTTTVKHFPGLGRVTANTDTATKVVDATTRRGDAYLSPFGAIVHQDRPAQVLMMSSAYYSRIDAKHPAVFSATTIATLVRHDLRFTGVVMSDDLGNARAVEAWTPGRRAVLFVGAGGDLVLTVNPGYADDMANALVAQAKRDPAFRAKVDAAALRVLTVKQTRGLLPR